MFSVKFTIQEMYEQTYTDVYVYERKKKKKEKHCPSYTRARIDHACRDKLTPVDKSEESELILRRTLVLSKSSLHFVFPFSTTDQPASVLVRGSRICLAGARKGLKGGKKKWRFGKIEDDL